MKYKSIILIASFVAFCLINLPHTYADEKQSDRFNLDLNSDEDGNTNPNLFLPYYWNSSWFSGVGFSNSSRLTQGTLTGFSDSRQGTIVEQQQLSINLLSFESVSGGLTYSVGGNYRITNIDRTEFGYLYLNNGSIDDYIAFDNLTEIAVSGLALRGDITWGSVDDDNSIRLGWVISPGDTLDVDQDTTFKPIITNSATGSSSKTQDLGYDLKLQTRHRMTDKFSIGLQLQYQVLPLEYDIKVLASTADSFQEATIDTTETTISNGIRFIFDDAISNGLDLVIGFSNEKVDVKDNVSGFTSDEDQSIFSLGFTSNF